MHVQGNLNNHTHPFGRAFADLFSWYKNFDHIFLANCNTGFIRKRQSKNLEKNWTNTNQMILPFEIPHSFPYPLRQLIRKKFYSSNCQEKSTWLENREQRKIRCLERDLNYPFRVSWAPLYHWSYRTNWDWMNKPRFKERSDNEILFQKKMKYCASNSLS